MEELDFSEDNGEALLILLRIAHSRFDDIPDTLSYTVLMDVAVLCDQYFCAKLVKPWLSQWLSKFKVQPSQPDRENWLFIAWTFKREDLFKESVVKMTQEAKINKKGEYLTKAGNKFSVRMPPGIIGKCLI